MELILIGAMCFSFGRACALTLNDAYDLKEKEEYKEYSVLVLFIAIFAISFGDL